MFKKLTGVAIAVAFALPMAASATVDIDFLVVDDGPNTTVEKGDTVRAEVTFDTDGEDVESFSWRLVGSDLPKVCVNTVDETNPDGGTFVRSFNILLGNNPEGTWDVEIKSFGDNGAGSSNLCESMDENDDTTFDDRITIVDNIDDNQDEDNDDNSSGSGDNQGGNGNGGNSGAVGDLQDMVANLTKQISCMVTGGTWVSPTCTPKAAPVANTKCATLATKLLGTQDNVYNQANVMLQGYLLGEGASIPALAAGASFGYKGPQTNAALALYKSTNQCAF